MVVEQTVHSVSKNFLIDGPEASWRRRLMISSANTTVMCVSIDWRWRSPIHTERDMQQQGCVYDLLTTAEATHPVPRRYLVSAGLPRFGRAARGSTRSFATVDGMQKPPSVTISPTLTTQQTADLLGISRPTLIKALDDGKLPLTRSGTHRRLALTDVSVYPSIDASSMRQSRPCRSTSTSRTISTRCSASSRQYARPWRPRGEVPEPADFPSTSPRRLSITPQTDAAALYFDGS